MPSRIRSPSLSVSQTPEARVMTRAPFLASPSAWVNGCM